MNGQDLSFKCRCFMDGDVVSETGRRRLWVYTGPFRGAFFHAGRETIDAPHMPLAVWKSDEECTPDEALANLSGWPEAQRYLMHIFDRHRTEYRRIPTEPT